MAAGQEFGLKRSVAYALENLGNISVLQGKYARAATRLRESFVIGRELSDQHLLLYLFSDLVKLESGRGRHDVAARLGGVVIALRTRLGLSMAPAEDSGRARALAAARTALGPPRYEEAHAEGAAMTLDHAIAYALHDAEAGLRSRHHA